MPAKGLHSPCIQHLNAGQSPAFVSRCTADACIWMHGTCIKCNMAEKRGPTVRVMPTYPRCGAPEGASYIFSSLMSLYEQASPWPMDGCRHEGVIRWSNESQISCLESARHPKVAASSRRCRLSSAGGCRCVSLGPAFRRRTPRARARNTTCLHGERRRPEHLTTRCRGEDRGLCSRPAPPRPPDF